MVLPVAPVSAVGARPRVPRESLAQLAALGVNVRLPYPVQEVGQNNDVNVHRAVDRPQTPPAAQGGRPRHC
ncbi:hypothetical protein BaRGS_00040189 [Batillaria attramentaria]|uniref:Uncharacterized protein n=1 Tax=Batillaria attramentaria TaxID=370345 RepID=A0ABD0J0W5_9CAEN